MISRFLLVTLMLSQMSLAYECQMKNFSLSESVIEIQGELYFSDCIDIFAEDLTNVSKLEIINHDPRSMFSVVDFLHEDSNSSSFPEDIYDCLERSTYISAFDLDAFPVYCVSANFSAHCGFDDINHWVCSNEIVGQNSFVPSSSSFLHEGVQHINIILSQPLLKLHLRFMNVCPDRHDCFLKDPVGCHNRDFVYIAEEFICDGIPNCGIGSNGYPMDEARDECGKSFKA